MVDRLKEGLNLARDDGTFTVTIPLYVFAILVFLIIVLVIIVWSLKRRRDPHFRLDDHSGLDELLPSITGMTDSDMEGGNAVRILHNGDGFFPVLCEDLSNAKSTINFEAYLWKKGKIADQIVDILARKAKEGVEVRLLVDASGGSGVGRKERKTLKKAGALLEKYHPYRLGNLGSLNNRDHRKIVVVDGRIAHLGGHCIVDKWLGNAEDKKHYRDISVRLEGPIVNRVQSCFSENWIEESGEVIAGERFFPHLEPVGKVPMHVVYTTAQGSTSSVELLHYLAIHAAQKQITIQNPYFLPDPEMIDAVIDAVERGVEVRVMLPATEASDHPIVQHASHHHFGTMLKKGVRIFQYKKTLLHQKVMTVDHIWSVVGSTNIDDRSFELNDEICVGIYDEGFAKELEQAFKEDLKYAEEVQFEQWPKRGLWHKLVDGTLYLINEQL